MKRNWIRPGVIALVVIMVLAFANCATGRDGQRCGPMTAGTFVTEARGYVDMIRVATTVDRTGILDVNVLSHRETQAMGTFAVDLMPGRIVRNQSLMVDVVTGATITSNAITRAVREALTEAGANINWFERTPAALPPVDQTLDFDVVIVGAGSAGLAAAMAAQDALSVGQEGLDLLNRRRGVLLIEKMDVPGGNTIRSSGRFHVELTHPGATSRFNAGLTGGHWMNHRDLLQYMIWNARHIGAWFGTRGMSNRPPPDHDRVIGDARGLIMGKLNAFKLWEGTVMYRVKAEEILMEGGRAVGIRARDLNNGGTITINARSVVLASGGYGYNFEMMRRYGLRPEITVTNNTPAATGEVIYMARDVGAHLIHMDFIQTHPTVHQASSTMLTEAIRRRGGILLNEEGRRFTNEQGFRDVVSDAILRQTNGHAALVFPWANMEDVNVIGYWDIGLIRPISSVADLASFLGVPQAALQETLTSWADSTRTGNDTFGVPILVPMTPGHRNYIDPNYPVFAAWVAPAVHYTMGGVLINHHAQVIHESANIAHLPTAPLSAAPAEWPVWPMGPVIPGLFAAGEIASGVHGGNRQGGNAITNILVFGRLAGYNAARFVDNLGPSNPWPWSVGDPAAF